MTPPSGVGPARFLHEQQLCRTHYASNLLATAPTLPWPWVRARLHSAHHQPDTASVDARYDRVL